MKRRALEDHLPVLSRGTLNMTDSVKVLFMLSLCLGLLALLAGCGLEERHLEYLVRILSQSGIQNPKNVEKLRLLPATLRLAGLNAFVTAGLVLFFRKKLSQTMGQLSRQLSSRQMISLFLLGTYLVIAFLMLNFGTVELIGRFQTTGHMTNEEIVASDYGEDRLLVRTLKSRTPEDANILIRTSNDIKYLLNYDLYPRRFYFYPDPERHAAEIPEEWLERYHISWILEVDDRDPRKFLLVKRR